MAGDTRILTFSEGVSVVGPSQSFLTASSLEVYASDGAYVAAKGSAATQGNIYLNSTDGYVHYYHTNWIIISAELNNFAATAAPTVNDDSADGYSVGSAWFDITNDKIYMAIDVTVGAAIWLEYGGPFVGFTEIPTGSVDGFNVDFTISATPIDGTILLKRNGLLVPASEWSFVHPIITFNTPPALAQKVEVTYITTGVSATRILTLTNQIFEPRTITAGEVTAKQITLLNTPAVPTEVQVDLRNGIAQFYSDDFIVTGNILDWSGRGLDGVVIAGTKMRVIYYI